MKKFLAAVSALLLTLCMFTGCAAEQSSQQSSVTCADDLVGKKIGVQIGTTGMTYAEGVEGATVEKYNKGADAIEALKQGKIDAVLIDASPAKYFVSKNSDIVALDDPFAVEEYACAVKKGNDELTQQINDALSQLRENGTLTLIEQNWLVDDEYGKHPYESPEGVTYDGKLVMATNAEFAPYEFKEEGKFVGFDVDMMTAVCDILGKELVIDDMAFDSIIAAVDSGKADVGVAGMTVTEDRLKNVNFTDSYTEASQVIIVKGMSTDLTGKTIGVQMGTTGMTYAEGVEGATVEKYNKGADAIEALKQGKVDVVLIDSSPAKYFVSKNPELSIAPKPFAVEKYACAIKKGNDELTQQINDALSQLRENGTLNLIEQNWLVDAEYGKHPYESPEGITYSGKLVMATNAEFPPYELKEEGEIVGFDVDMMRAVCDIIGKELVIDDMAFDSVIAAVDSGKADVGVAGMTVTEDRLKNVNFSDSYTEASQVIIYKSGNASSQNFVEKLKSTFLDKDRWVYLVQGLGNTLLITVLAVVIGIVLGFVIAIIRSTNQLTGRLKIPNFICRIYLTVVRGTPMVVQLLIIYFVVFSSVNIEQNWLVDAEYGKHPYESPEGITYSGKLVMATNAEFPPYELKEEGEIVGFDVDMMRAVCDIIGKELVIDDMAFDSVIAAVDSGKADVGVAGMTVTEDRLKNVNFSDSYTEASQVIIYKSGNASSQNFVEKLKSTFLDKDRWVYLVQGLGNTLLITVLAVVIGIVLGFVIAIIRSTNQLTGRLKIPNFICRIYLTVVRGTPMVVQLLIIYFVVFSSVNISKILVAVIAFGLNSAAYVAEIVRSGIMSVDRGQFEAGSSLGFGYTRTMISIILPQAIRNILPALGNEAIVLLKETSVSGYIALNDLTKGGDTIRSQTYEAFLPLIAVALIYLLMVVGLSALVNRLERRLSNDKRK